MWETINAILENDFAFRQAHRGSILTLGTSRILESSFDGTRTLYFGDSSKNDLNASEFDKIYFLPWADPNYLMNSAQGFEDYAPMCQIVLHSAGTKEKLSEIEIGIVSTVREIEEFTLVQATCFPERSQEAWVEYLLTQNLKNVGDARNRFYLGRVQGNPAATMLTFQTGHIVGAFAGAVAPNYQKLGFSSAMMARVQRDVFTLQQTCLVGQTDKDSSGEHAWRATGFTTVSQIRRLRKSAVRGT